MEGVVWGAVAGVAFGLFQATNRRANGGVDPFVATFVVILVSLVALGGLALLTEQPLRLIQAPPSALIAFALGGFVNFFLGWTFLALAQQRVGAGPTSVVAGTAPLFGTGVAYVFIGEAVALPALLGVVLVVVGVGLLASSQNGTASGTAAAGKTGFLFAGLTAVSWGSSAVFARHGLEQVAMPLSGVSVGMAASAVAYGLALAVRRMPGGIMSQLPRRAIAPLAVAGVLSATGIGAHWLSLGLVPVAIALALNQLAVPVVLVAAPLILGASGERLSRPALVGAGLAVVGTVIIILARSGAST